VKQHTSIAFKIHHHRHHHHHHKVEEDAQAFDIQGLEQVRAMGEQLL
jgi:hypothetical protein